MEAKEQVLAVVRQTLSDIGTTADLKEETVLAEIGVGSMQVITVLFALKRTFDFDLDRVVQSGIPVTVGDIVRLFT